MSAKEPGDSNAPTVRVPPPDLFPQTVWTLITQAGSPQESDRRRGLEFIATHYWRPIFCYIRGRGFPPADAEDLVQGFFEKCLRENTFARADRARGRFRAFLLSSLKNHLANVVRDARAAKRRPAQGFVPVHELASVEGPYRVPADPENPERIFNRAWACELLLRVAKALEAEYAGEDRRAHRILLRRRIIEPALRGDEPPPLADLAGELGVTEKQAANLLLTARRAFQRLLRREIRTYAGSEEEAAEELREIFRQVAG